LWFDEEPNQPDSVDVFIYRHRPDPISHNACRPSLTLISDLTSEDSAIVRNFGSTTRYEINRAHKKDGLRAETLTPGSAQVAEFADFYDAFAGTKALERAYRRGLNAAAAAQQLVLTTASAGREVLIWHAYIVWRHSVALLHSASHFREKSKTERTLVGRANRWLHWQDMLYFKRIGLHHYDWGGVFQDESSPARAGINSFKYEFGGRPVTTYDCTLPATRRGRLYLAGRAFFDRVARNLPA
jgi:hypothetical protein